MTFGSALLVVMLCVASITSIMIVRMPDINALSLQHRIRWPLPNGGGRSKLTATCREISEYHRWNLQEITGRLLMRSSIIALFIVGGVCLYVMLECPHLATSIPSYLAGRTAESFFIFAPEYELPEAIPRYLDQLVGCAISLAVGSIVVYLLAFSTSWVVSALFPVRWVKWAKITKVGGIHNRQWRNRRRLSVLIDHTQRCSPEPGDTGYGYYDNRRWI